MKPFGLDKAGERLVISSSFVLKVGNDIQSDSAAQKLRPRGTFSYDYSYLVADAMDIKCFNCERCLVLCLRGSDLLFCPHQQRICIRPLSSLS
jgi:hypothetical protein